MADNQSQSYESSDEGSYETSHKRSDEGSYETSHKRSEEELEDMTEWLDSIDMLLTSVELNYIQSCSISIVPEELINSSNKEDHMPKVVSIGPRFKGSKEDLHLMEEVKLRSMLYLLHRAGEQGKSRKFFRECGEAIWKLDKQVRASYVSDIKLKREELAKIMLMDGCFLLELVIAKGFDSKLPSRFGQLPSGFHPPSPAFKVLKDEEVLSDLILLENQIPILVLHELSKTLFPNEFPKPKDPDKEDMKDMKDRAEKINNLILSIIGYSQPEVQNPSYFKAPHILDIVHFFVNSKGERKHDGVGNYVVPIIGTDQHPKPKLNRCASRLQAAGVTIKLLEEKHGGNSCFSFLRNCFGGICIRLGNMLVTTNTQVDVAEEVKGLDFYFNFEKGKLEIARLEITKTTKAKWRNIIAWEHHKNNWKCFENVSAAESGSNDNNQIDTSSFNRNFTSSALIFDGLVCCAADVKLLKDKNIIVDHLKMSDEELEDFFHSMSFGVDLTIVDSSYVKIVDDLNNYSHAFFVLRILKIFSHLFKGRLEWLFKFLKQNYNFVAAMLAFLTLVQTVYTVISYHLPK